MEKGEKTNVLIINQGNLKEGAYDGIITLIRQLLESESSLENPVITEVVDSVKVFEELVSKREKIDIVILVSTSMIEESRRLQEKYKGISIVVFVGRYPPEEPLILGKEFITPDTMKKILALRKF